MEKLKNGTRICIETAHNKYIRMLKARTVTGIFT